MPLASSSEAILSNPAILENVKKCRSFLSTLLKLAAGQQPETLVKVSKLVQDLIVSGVVCVEGFIDCKFSAFNLLPNTWEILFCRQDGAIEEEAFTNRLEVELKSEPQPTLVTFLKVATTLVICLLIE